MIMESFGTCPTRSMASFTILCGVQRKLTWHIQAQTAPNKSYPDLQIFWRLDPSGANYFTHSFSCVTWMYEVCGNVCDRMVLSRSISFVLPLFFLTCQGPAYTHADTPHHTHILHSSSEVLWDQYIMKCFQVYYCSLGKIMKKKIKDWDTICWGENDVKFDVRTGAILMVYCSLAC